MDDWNDFGSPPPSNSAVPTPTRAVHYAPSSSASSVSSVSVSSVPSPNDPEDSDASDIAPADPTLHHDQQTDSFAASLPFLSRNHHRENNVSPNAFDEPHIGPHIADRDIDEVGGDISDAGNSDGIEPVSRMIKSKKFLNPDGDFESSESTFMYTPRRGELDDVPDDYELNIEGFRLNSLKGSNMSDLDADGQSSVIASSLLRHVDRTYTKLEVISARQVKNLIAVFNLFAAIGLGLTLLFLIVANTSSRTIQDLPIPEAFLTDAQIATAVDNVTLPADIGVFQEALAAAGAGAPQRQLRTTFRQSYSGYRSLIPPALHAVAEARMRCQGVALTAEGFVAISPHTEDCGKWVSVGSHLSPLYGVSHQEDGSGEGQGEEDAPPIDGEGPPSEGTDGAAVDGQGDGAAQPPQPEPGSIQPPPQLNYPPGTTFIVLWTIPTEAPVFKQRYILLGWYLNAILSVFFLILWGLYGFRLFRVGWKNVTHEQVWVFVLIIVASIYFNLFESAIRIVEASGKGLDVTVDEQKLSPATRKAEEVLNIFREAAFLVVLYFYLWASFHSYRILNPLQRLNFRTFYLPKLVILVPFGIYIGLVYALLDLRLSEIPVITAPIFAFYFSDYRVWNYLRAELLCILAKSVVELGLIILLCYEARKTMHVLESAPYMKHRTKRVGFRFFLYINFVFYVLFILIHLLLLFAVPRGIAIIQIIYGTDRVLADVLFYLTGGANVLLGGYVLVTAYVHLPYTSLGSVKGWFVSSKLAPSSSRWSFSSGELRSEDEMSLLDREDPTVWGNDENTPSSLVDNDEELQQQIVEPITYRKRESKNSLELKANCFTMQTHVIMFNFAWYVYYYGTPKLENFRPKENPLPFSYRIAAHVRRAETDTQALVVDCSDRIIVTFKGTTSMKNLRTSMRVSHERLSSVVRTNVYGEDESGRLKRLFKTRYARGKIHSGFATAYSSIANEVMEYVQQLREKKKRPVFLTGHSLGGALATICSLDLWVKLDISRREIFVSTFGSPRVGNREFAEIYREVVPLHWRIVVDPDMVARLPSVGYSHVGKKVVLTPHGEMIIDPTALERRPWSGETAGFAYHRKASYLLAMRAWCVRHHGMTYTPVFWPFPVRPEDERRFAGAFEDEEGPTGGKVAARIIRMDAMVDALGQGDTELANMAVIEKWARLTRRALLNDKLRVKPAMRT